MTKNERALQSDGRLAARRGEDLAAGLYQRLRSPASRKAFRDGYEAERRAMTAETATPEQIAESAAAAADLKAWAAENL
jgi:hypothetical protein